MLKICLPGPNSDTHGVNGNVNLSDPGKASTKSDAHALLQVGLYFTGPRLLPIIPRLVISDAVVTVMMSLQHRIHVACTPLATVYLIQQIWCHRIAWFGNGHHQIPDHHDCRVSNSVVCNLLNWTKTDSVHPSISKRHDDRLAIVRPCTPAPELGLLMPIVKCDVNGCVCRLLPFHLILRCKVLVSWSSYEG